MASTIAAYQMIASSMTRSLERTANQPQVARETAYYRANIGKVTSISDFLGNYRLLSYALKAYGLGDMAYATAFVRKLLTEGTTSSTAFANKLSDARYRDFVNAFNFAGLGSGATQTTAAQTDIVNKYIRQTLEEQAGSDLYGASQDGVRLALYFQRKAPGITNAFQILADPALLQVVQTSLGFSPLTSRANIDQQAKMITSRINFQDFQDPKKLDSFITRFAALWDYNNPSATNVSVPQIVIGQPAGMGLSADTLMTLQGLKIGKK